MEMATSEAAEGVSERLGADHRRLDDLLAETKRVWADGDPETARRRFHAFREGLERHIEVEERVLFPAFETLTGTTPDGPTGGLRMEHRELRKLLAEVAVQLEEAPPAGRAPVLPVLEARLAAHNDIEERRVYPTVDRLARKTGALANLVHRLAMF
ncbi:hemerythrin domain-containing protein [Myxococcota bacterium]|nr:hemerythrin domain-containing protein [Myxococcota bacterium]